MLNLLTKIHSLAVPTFLPVALQTSDVYSRSTLHQLNFTNADATEDPFTAHKSETSPFTF